MNPIVTELPRRRRASHIDRDCTIAGALVVVVSLIAAFAGVMAG